MLSKLFKKKTSQIFAPINGEIIALEDVPDPVFSQKMMGEGLAIIPAEGKVNAPVNGKIVQVAPTKHAIGIVADDGTEILIHVGLETVALKGEGFKVAVKTGDKVTTGQPLLEFDLGYIKEHAKSIVTPIVITNSNDGDKQYAVTKEKNGIMGKTPIISVTAK